MNQIRTGMMKSLDNQDSMIQKFSEIQSHNEGLKERLDHLVDKHEGFVQQITEILSSIANSFVRFRYNRSQASQLETDLMNTMQNSPKEMEDEDVSRLKMSPSRLGRVRNQFIDIFRYNSMFDREASVTEAHRGTLKWIFDDSPDETRAWNNLGQWFESEDQLYWITGKMGSGKSTLMKYISEELPISGKFPENSEAGKRRRCTPYLLRWAQGRPLFIATFYFWAGSIEETKIQTSAEGLYRTFITQILEVYPEAASHISPRRWENVCLFNKDSEPLGITELKTILTKSIEYVICTAKVCLFIDGLDEFEGDNDELEGLINWVKTLVETSPTKVCVASRPWRVFEDALQDRPHLLMEDFNFKDIQQYVWSRFHDDPNFRAKKQMEAAFCNQLLDEIVTKAEGVFLWVHLVCTRLLGAMSRGDVINDLRKILNKLPAKMEKLYGHILDNLDLKDHAAKYFLLVQACLGRPSALIFSFADDICEDSTFPLRMRKQSLTDTQLQYRITELKKRLNSRCRGLLTLSIEPLNSRAKMVHVDTGSVQCCHRSAKDYLAMGMVQEKLLDMLEGPFDPHLTLCSAHLARSKCCSSDYPDWNTSVYKCAEHAAMVANESSDMMIQILDGLDPDFDGQFIINHDYFRPHPWFGGKLLSFTVVLGVSKYVKSKVERGRGCVVRSSPFPLVWNENESVGCHTGIKAVYDYRARMRQFQRLFGARRSEKIEWPLLLDALLAAVQPNPEMVFLLLKNGTDPNLIIRGSGWKKSALDVVLDHLIGRKFSNVDAAQAWLDSMCLLLQYGAKPHKSDVKFLRKFIGKDSINELKLPHVGNYRDFISQLPYFFSELCYRKVPQKSRQETSARSGLRPVLNLS